MAVYKENLATVIEPTIRSLEAAMATYEMQGGSANLFVNDDGMQLIDEEDAQIRQDFYEEHNIGWVARPAHTPVPKYDDEGPYIRRGKFKKASNLNYGLWTSVKVEHLLAQLERDRGWNEIHERAAYAEALGTVLDEMDGETWADGDIRIGEFILIVDSDTRVPIDCLQEAISEMGRAPQIAVLQYISGVMNVTTSFFEKGITFFTNLIYTQIRFAVANGDVAPFVGHNAILRWSALQEVAYYCPLDNHLKWWSETTVSEDFDMALRLQESGYVVRLGAYKGFDYQEGVSLSVYDEISRWEKYAFGCNELIFNPLCYWLTRGPFNKLFIRFITSGMPLCSKFTIVAYIGTYYALGSAWILTILNYILVGWFNGWLDHYYIDSFKVYFSIILVFTGVGNIALAVLRYRIKDGSFLRNILRNIVYIPLLVVFLGGISLHISQALLCHFFNIDMSWGATAKEAEHTPFFQEIPRVVRKFGGTLIFCVLLSLLLIIMACAVPPFWRIDFFTAIWPLAVIVMCHLLLPILLNPNLMLFTW